MDPEASTWNGPWTRPAAASSPVSREPDLGRILALDYGTRRVGLALSDPGRVIAQPLATWEAEAPDFIDRLRELVSAQDVDLIVVGNPITLGGEEGPAAGRARAFADRVRNATGLEVVLVDERFSTTEAERALMEGEMRRADRRNARDRVAAALILQSYLERAD